MLLFRSCFPKKTAKPKRAKKPKLWLFWDIDGTMFNIPQSKEDFAAFCKYNHMTKIQHSDNSYVFMIYLEKTRAAFNYLLEMKKEYELEFDIEIAFMTAGGYGEEILLFLERALGLPPDSLSNSILINRYIFEGVFLKGEKLQLLRGTGMIGSDDQAILIDNLQEHITNVRHHGFLGVLAEGFCEEVGQEGDVIMYHPSSRYLDELRNLVAVWIVQQQEIKRQTDLKEKPVNQSQAITIAVIPEPSF